MGLAHVVRPVPLIQPGKAMGDPLSLNPHSVADSSTVVSHRCREFESALRDGSRPTIEGYLGDTEGEDREHLVLALVRVEIQFRLQCGERPELAQYLARFPDYAPALKDVVPPLLGEHGGGMMSTFVAPPGSPKAVDAPDQFKRQLGRYQLENVLGRGGFGEVWKAFDPILQRVVAIKTLRRDRELSAAALESFLNEGRHLARLKHPGIVSVYDVGVEEGRAYIVSEFVEGTTLQKLIDHKRFTWQEAALLVAAIADALQKAHESNIFHRDIKPSNVLMDQDGIPHVADFGLAATEEQQMAESASTLGTFGYMPPEQVCGQSQLADGRADIYSLGVILYRLLTDRLPFIAKDVEQYRTQVLYRSPRPLRQIIPNLPEDLERTCLKCLAKSPEHRFLTASDLAAELRRILASESAMASPASLTSTAISRHWWMAALCLAVIVAAIPWLRSMLAKEDGDGRSVEVSRGGTGSRADEENSARQNIADIEAETDDRSALIVRELVVAADVDDVTSEIVSSGNALRVLAPAQGLVQLGEYEEGRLSFDVEIQPNGAVFAGLFFGHQTHGNDAERVRYLAVEIQAWQTEGQQLVVHMPDYEIRNQSLGGGTWVGNVAVPLDARRTAHTIGVTIENGRLTDVRLNGESIPGILDKWEERIPVDFSCAGAFGFTCTGGGATFRNPRLNEIQAHFSVEPSSPEANQTETDTP